MRAIDLGRDPRPVAVLSLNRGRQAGIVRAQLGFQCLSARGIKLFQGLDRGELLPVQLQLVMQKVVEGARAFRPLLGQTAPDENTG